MKRAFFRQNGYGLNFHIRGESDGTETVIECITRNKTLMVKCNIENISQGWYYWQIQGKFIQDAFPFMNAGEREFLITALLPAEFDELMKEPEE